MRSKRWTMDIFESIYERFEESGLPPKSFCLNEGILPDRFYDWRRKLLAKRGEFIPVKINIKRKWANQKLSFDTPSSNTSIHKLT